MYTFICLHLAGFSWRGPVAPAHDCDIPLYLRWTGAKLLNEIASIYPLPTPFDPGGQPSSHLPIVAFCRQWCSLWRRLSPKPFLSTIRRISSPDLTFFFQEKKREKASSWGKCSQLLGRSRRGFPSQFLLEGPLARRICERKIHV